MMSHFITKISDNQHTHLFLLHPTRASISNVLTRCLKQSGSRLFLPRVMSLTVSKPPSGHFNLLYFASANTFTGKEVEALAAPLPLRKLFATLEKLYPGIKSKVLESCLVTINLNYVDVPKDSDEGDADEPVIQEGDEVAIIPPVSSG